MIFISPLEDFQLLHIFGTAVWIVVDTFNSGYVATLATRYNIVVTREISKRPSRALKKIAKCEKIAHVPDSEYRDMCYDF